MELGDSPGHVCVSRRLWLQLLCFGSLFLMVLRWFYIEFTHKFYIVFTLLTCCIGLFTSFRWINSNHSTSEPILPTQRNCLYSSCWKLRWRSPAVWSDKRSITERHYGCRLTGPSRVQRDRYLRWSRDVARRHQQPEAHSDVSARLPVHPACQTSICRTA